MVRKFVASAVVAAGLAGGLVVGQGVASADVPDFTPPDMPAGAEYIGHYPNWDACQLEWYQGAFLNRYQSQWHICYRRQNDERDLWALRK